MPASSSADTVYSVYTGRHGIGGGGSGGEGSRGGALHGGGPHPHGPSLPARAAPPAATTADIQPDRQPPDDEASISTAQALSLLEQLAPSLQARTAEPAAAHQFRPADPVAAPQPQAADLAVVPQPELAGPVVPVNDGLLAAVRELLLALRLAILRRARRYAAVCAALGRKALSVNWAFIIGYSREAAFEVRPGNCIWTLLFVDLDDDACEHDQTEAIRMDLLKCHLQL